MPESNFIAEAVQLRDYSAYVCFRPTDFSATPVNYCNAHCLTGRAEQMVITEKYEFDS